MPGKECLQHTLTQRHTMYSTASSATLSTMYLYCLRYLLQASIELHLHGILVPFFQHYFIIYPLPQLRWIILGGQHGTAFAINEFSKVSHDFKGLSALVKAKNNFHFRRWRHSENQLFLMHLYLWAPKQRDHLPFSICWANICLCNGVLQFPESSVWN